MRAWKMLYVLFGLMAAVLCVLRATPRGAAVAGRPKSGSSTGALARVAGRPRVATGSLARLAADSRHSRGDALARQLNSWGGLISSAGSTIGGSYALLAADARRAATGNWVERLIESETTGGTQQPPSRRAHQPQQLLGNWSGWSGCSPYAARRDHLGRPVQTVARASVSFRTAPAPVRPSVPVVLPALGRVPKR